MQKNLENGHNLGYMMSDEDAYTTKRSIEMEKVISDSPHQILSSEKLKV